MATVQRLCVYCGSAGRVSETYRQAARDLGTTLARHGIELVYGGGRVGLMGLCADATMEAGGRVTGIIPRHLHDVEVGHHGLTRLLVTENMHERKRVMFEMSDAFLVLPGGLGTLDETFEIITWRQLGLHDKPIVVIDVDGYWQPFQAMVQHIIDQGFARPSILSLFKVVPSIEAAFAAIELAREPAVTPAPDLV
jgi:uncharacterized protein (TIGR00730 family)